jgi:hypothetical protein
MPGRIKYTEVLGYDEEKQWFISGINKLHLKMSHLFILFLWPTESYLF